MSQKMIYAGTSYPKLACQVADYLKLTPANLLIERYEDGEIGVHLTESPEGKEVFLFQSLSSKPNRFLMELLIVIDALKQARAKSIKVVFPYMAYGRREHIQKRAVLSTKLLANLLKASGADGVIALEVGDSQRKHFFDFPFHDLELKSLMNDAIQKKDLTIDTVLSLSPQKAQIAFNFAQTLGAKTAFISRVGQEWELFGSIENKKILLVDDLACSLNELREVCKFLKMNKVNALHACFFHNLLDISSLNQLVEEGIESLITTNSCVTESDVEKSSRIELICVAKILAEAIERS